MKKRAMVTQRWVPYAFVLVLLLGGGLAGCRGAPPAPETVPEGPDIMVEAGETIAVQASAEGASRYEWRLGGAGKISETEGPAILYTAPDEPGMATLSVTAHNSRGTSPPTSLIINVYIPCPVTDAEGTVSPDVAVSSITFVVNGVEQVVDDPGSLQAFPGDQVKVKEVTICANPFDGKGGQACVEFDPVDTGGNTIEREIRGTRAGVVDPGFTTIEGPDYTWNMGENWRHISVATVHYPAPPQKTENAQCERNAPYICEVDDRMIVPIQSSAPTELPSPATSTPMPTVVPTSTPTSIPADPARRALWVWNEEVVTNDDAKVRFLDFIWSEHINAIYLHAYGLLSINPTALEGFIAEASDVEVELLAGDPSWALTANHSKVLDFVQEAIAFRQDVGRTGRPVGLHFDIEPYLLDEWNNDQERTITQYLDLLVAVKKRLTEAEAPLLLSADIPFWYDTIEATYNGETKPLHQHVQDIVDCVVIMDYRDTAGGGDGIVAHARNELFYANKMNKLVTIGLETNCIEPAKITFCEEGRAVMEQELSEAKLCFEASPAFHGFAVHDYVGYAGLSQLASMPVPSPTGPPTPTGDSTPILTPSPTPEETPMATLPPTLTPLPTPVCPTADAEGTVSPAVAIYSITFVVNGAEQVVNDTGSLRASPGTQVQVREVTICSAEPFEGSGGSVYVEFDPVDQNGQVIASEVKGTRAVGVTPGFTSIPGPDYTWTIGDNWRHLSVVTVHYPPGGGTQNSNCEGGACEVDDRVIVPIE